MFKLNDLLDDNVQIDNKDYHVHMAFDNVMDALDALSDLEMNQITRMESFIEIMLQDDDICDELDFENQGEITQLIIEKINTEPIESQPFDVDGEPMPKARAENNEDNVISFDIDAKYIYAAFMQSYHLDLIEQQGKLHWTKFSALLNALPDDTLMRQIIDIRKTDLSEIKDKKEKSRIKKLKRQFALPDSQSEEGGENYG